MNIQTGASSVRISFMGTTGSNTLQLSQPLRIPFNQETNKKKKEVVLLTMILGVVYCRMFKLGWDYL